jgi:hypothetical protein
MPATAKMATLILFLASLLPTSSPEEVKYIYNIQHFQVQLPPFSPSETGRSD